MKENSEKSHLRVSKKGLVFGSVIATLLAITPILFNLYQSVPDQRVWDTFLFSYDSGDWESANYAMWILTGKAIPLLLLLIWFFTNRHWWYHALLVPIFMYIYQIISIYNDGAEVFDEMHFYYMIPVMAFVIPSIYLMRARIFNKINEASKSLEELEEEFNIGPKSLWGKIKQYF